MAEQTGKWDAFSSAASRLDDDFAWRDVIIYEWQREYDPATGEYDYGSGPVEVARVQAEVRKPTTPITVVGPEGGEAEVDLEVYLPPDAPDVTPAGTEERASVLEDTVDNRRLTCTEVYTEDTGLKKVSCVER
jgi:hypothetical protein